MFDDVKAEVEERYGDNAREIDPDHWILEVMTDNNRSQIVHLLHKQKRIDGQDVSRVVADSPIGPLPKRFDLEQLLRRNSRLDVGAICIEDFRNDDNELVTYITLRASHLLSTLDKEEVWEMIDELAFMADRLEQEIYARDLH